MLAMCKLQGPYQAPVAHPILEPLPHAATAQPPKSIGLFFK